MMDQNARVTYAHRRTFYNFTRRYGVQVELRKVLTSGTDYKTGSRSRTYETVKVRNAVYVPPITKRSVEYTPAMMQAIRQFAWQGGAGQDVQASNVLIYERDIKTWGEIDSTQEIKYRGVWYKVEDVQLFEGGVVVSLKTARGTHDA